MVVLDRDGRLQNVSLLYFVQIGLPVEQNRKSFIQCCHEPERRKQLS